MLKNNELTTRNQVQSTNDLWTTTGAKLCHGIQGPIQTRGGGGGCVTTCPATLGALQCFAPVAPSQGCLQEAYKHADHTLSACILVEQL